MEEYLNGSVQNEQGGGHSFTDEIILAYAVRLPNALIYNRFLNFEWPAVVVEDKAQN